MRTIAAAAVAVLALTGCSSGSDDKPQAPAGGSAAASPTVDREAARRACVNGWLSALERDPDTEDEPAVCSQVPGQRAAMYAEAVRRQLQGNRDRMDDCLEDPACTELPIR